MVVMRSEFFEDVNGYCNALHKDRGEGSIHASKATSQGYGVVARIPIHFLRIVMRIIMNSLRMCMSRRREDSNSHRISWG